MTTPSLTTSTSSRQQLGIAILRIVTGLVFTVHGAQKLFVFGFAGVTGAFGKMGLPMPGLLGPVVALLEFFGGLALIIGVLTRLAAIGLAVEMLGAILVVHLAAGFFNPGGFEYPLTLVSAMICIALAGPGSLSVDSMLASRRGGVR
jgi:putative oxidoreductase